MRISRKAMGWACPLILGVGLVIGCTTINGTSDREPAGKKSDKTKDGAGDEKLNTLSGPHLKPFSYGEDYRDFDTKFVLVDSVIELCGMDLKKADAGSDPEEIKLDLGNPADQKRLEDEIRKLADLAKAQDEGKKKEKDDGVIRRQCRITKGMKKGMKEMARLMPIAFGKDGDLQTRMDARMHIAVLADVVSNQFRYPIFKTIDVLEGLPTLVHRETNFVGEGVRGPSKNIGGAKSDNGKQDPVASTFWTRKKDLSTQNLYYGFGRSKLPLKKDDVCEYDEPKAGYGIHGGFDMKCDGDSFKIRFGNEIYSGAFNTRIFSALGYNVMPFDHVEGLKVKYERELFTEYNKRSDFGFDLTFAWVVTITDFKLQEYVNPMEMVQSVVLKDGTKLTKAQFAEKFFVNPSLEKPELQKGNINEDFESQIEFINLNPATVSKKSKKYEEIGGFDWNNVDYRYRREFRAAGIVAAWIGWYDSRWDNTKLVFDGSEDDKLSMKHMISDLGSGLGKTGSILSTSNADANGYTWGLVERRGESSTQNNIGIFRGFGTLDGNRAFYAANTDDTKWIVRQIAQLTRDQIKQALIATGLSAAEVKLLLEKVLYRRDSMVAVYGMRSEFPMLAKENPHSEFNYNPLEPKAEAMSVTVDGKTITAPDRGYVVVQGVVCARSNVKNGTCSEPKLPFSEANPIQ